MFSLQHSSSANLFVQIPSTTLPHQCHDLLLDDLLLDPSLFDGAISGDFNQVSSTITTTPIINHPPSSKSRKRNNAGVVTDNKIPFAGAELVDSDGKRIFDENGGGQENKKKRMMHREIERLRRQEMSKLYASLRSLLPVEFIKGKRSISDHMHQAVSYIKHKQENIKCLSLKREKLKKSTTVTDNNNVILNGPGSNFNHGSITTSTIGDTGLDDHRVLHNRVVVDACHDGSTAGFEIRINTRLSGGHGGLSSSTAFSLSRVLNVISQQGLNVTSCTSTRVNERLQLCSIQSEASGHDQDLTGIDHLAYELQQKLSDVVNM